MPFDHAIETMTKHLQQQGFGVLTSIDVKETFRKKLDVDFRKYKILGVCNPEFAYKALSIDPNIGVMLPCNVTVQELGPGEVQVSVINPMETIASAGADSPELQVLAIEVSDRLMASLGELSEEVV